MTDEQRQAFFLDIHRTIEETATRTAAALRSGTLRLMYPPNGGFTSAEQEALGSLQVSPVLESALRKVIASASIGPLFRACTLLDGVANPHDFGGTWPVFSIREAGGDEGSVASLHDELFETYWRWREKRPEKSWRLDLYEE